ncbi:MAG: hypothetical protein HOI80_00985 [Alphaproteobacteria bacterium]|jgi:hypothetical protein|nr:hypothetical protein [Alphaproteobacteria bacterium]MBT5390666.1 hypothetical protein [Alphaproteobacteria bacterium]MBT5540949.1 hypothetical protein [Alphaproteobacteria bacterium]MBT5654062.1 hypothetical protein [Alphaproteobacteria bacterium]
MPYKIVNIFRKSMFLILILFMIAGTAWISTSYRIIWLWLVGSCEERGVHCSKSCNLSARGDKKTLDMECLAACRTVYKKCEERQQETK